MKLIITILGLSLYSAAATVYAVPEVKREIADWGFNERMVEAAKAKDDAQKAKQAGVIDESVIRALGG